MADVASTDSSISFGVYVSGNIFDFFVVESKMDIGLCESIFCDVEICIIDFCYRNIMYQSTI